MQFSYKKLWKILIDRDMLKKDLSRVAGISVPTVTKMANGGHISTSVLEKICVALDCTFDDIMELKEKA